MANILIGWQGDASGRLPVMASAAAAGARTVRGANVRLLSLEAIDIGYLSWCDGLVLGVDADPARVVDALANWQKALEPRFWEAVQGKFASVFVAARGEVRRRECAHDRAVRFLTENGILVPGFIGTRTSEGGCVESPRGHFHHECERLGRLSTGMVHAWTGRTGNPRRRRILGSLVRATRRVPAMRPGTGAHVPVSSYSGLSGATEVMAES